MSNFQYHTVIPENNKASFTEYDNVDFVMTFENRALNLNSLRVEGDLSVTTNSKPLSDSSNVQKKIFMDHLVGSHSLCESIQTSFFNGTNLIENLTEYGRYVKMRNACRKARGDMNNASNVCELLAPTDQMTNLVLKGVTPPVNQNNAGSAELVAPLSPDFSFKPQICLNNAQTDGMAVLPYSKSGAIRLTLNLARINAVLFGQDVDGTTQYTISNLQVSFTSVPETPDLMNNKIVMNTVQSVKPSVESQFANIGVKVPAICNAVSISFQPQDEENTAYNNNYQLTKVPNLTELQYLFNDSTNSLVSYLLRDYEEIVNRGIESMFSTGKNSLSINNLNNNNGFVAGLYFDDYIDLRNQKFNVQLTSGITGGSSSLLMCLYFHSIISL
jgi:hypothetical protein